VLILRIGKFFAQSKEEESVEIKDELKIIQPQVKFYRLSDVVNAEPIVEEVKTGNLVFLNIGKINPYPDRRKRFLTSLKFCASESFSTVRMVSEDTVMIIPSTIPIHIRNLGPANQKDRRVEE